MADRDIGEMFLKFMLSEEVRPFCTVDVSNVRNGEDWERVYLGGWEIWERNMMGLTDSPYHACQTVTWARKIALGNRRDPSKPLKWDRAVVNL